MGKAHIEEIYTKISQVKPTSTISKNPAGNAGIFQEKY